MEATRDSDWLVGDPSWWPHIEGLASSDLVGLEIEPSSLWDGWKRQRLKPMAQRFVYAPAWSIGLLFATIFPLIFSDDSMSNQNIVSVLFLSSFVLLHLQPFRIASEMPGGDGFKMLKWIWFGGGFSNMSRTLGFTFLGFFFFICHILIDVRIGWISYLIFIFLWFHITLRAGNALIPSPGRWLFPLGQDKFDSSKLSSEWSISRERFFPGCLANYSLNYGMELEIVGVRRREHRFLAFHLRHPSSLLYDPFVNVEKIPSIGGFGLGYCGARIDVRDELLSSPPLIISVADWPECYVRNSEDE